MKSNVTVSYKSHTVTKENTTKNRDTYCRYNILVLASINTMAAELLKVQIFHSLLGKSSFSPQFLNKTKKILRGTSYSH